MDWRAKSQSRSRSRMPDAMMDWRAQSRSRSRAPDFRLSAAPLPPVASFDSATAQIHSLPSNTLPTATAPSRFFGDRGGISIPQTPIDEKDQFDLAVSLGLASGGVYLNQVGPYVTDELDFSLGITTGGGSTAATSNLSSIEDTINHLINLQTAPSVSPASSSSWSTHDRRVSSETPYGFLPTKGPNKGNEGFAYPSLAQQQLQQVVNQVGFSVTVLCHC